VPEWLVGKTMTEAAALTGQLYNQLIAGQGQQVRMNAPAPTYAPTHAAPDWATDPMAATRAVVAQDFEARDQILGAQARALAEMRYADDFKRWGPEIDMALGQIPPGQRTPQVVDWIVRGVRGSHIDEITAEEAKRHVERLVQSGTLRPQAAGEGAGGVADNRVDFDKLPPRYASVLKNLGVTASTVDEMLRSAYPNLPLAKAREKWMKAASKGDVITDDYQPGKYLFEGDVNG
jgi:hypothetical protein